MKKKIKLNPKKSLPIKINPNPFIKTQLKRLSSLIDNEVTMLIFDRSGYNIGTKLNGILKYQKGKWIFQFNPLNQTPNEYEKRELKKTLPHSEWEFEEEGAVSALELEFLNNQPTFEFEFYDFDINQVVKNKILLNFIEPKIQEI